jgi:nitroimidazol reductase NimA-like FMN-containing flavoprotein (pyridoxamine 5'-phosphate oxidase superfamily)
MHIEPPPCTDQDLTPVAGPGSCRNARSDPGYDGWRSAIVQGDYEELTDAEDVARALDLLQSRFGRKSSESNRRLVGETTVVFRIAIREVTGRAVVRQ